MPTRDVRVGAFEQSAPIERPLHWRTLLEERESFFKLMMEYEDTADEVAGSETAMKVISNLS